MDDTQQRQRGIHTERGTARATSLAWLLRLLAAVLLVAALALGVWHALVFVRHSAAALATPYPLDGLEGTLLHEAWLLRAGEALYQPLRPDRFVSSPYPPLHYVAMALLAPPDGALHVFFGGRLVSLGAMLVVALALALAVLRLTRSLPIALIAVALWLAFPPVQLWATRVKPDPLALAFTSLGLLAIVTRNREPRTENRSDEHRNVSGFWSSVSGLRFLVFAAVCFVLACFTKQTAVAAPLATGVALLVAGAITAFRTSPEKNVARLILHPALRPTLVFAILYTVLVAVTWLTLDLVTSGQYTFHIWGLHRSEWWSAALLWKYVELLGPSWPLILLGVAAIGLAVRRVLTSTQAVSAATLLPACYLLVAPITLLGAGETGANHNHLLEIHLALILAGCTMSAHFITYRISQIRQSAMFVGVFLMLFLQLWVFRERPAWYGGEFDLTDTPARYVTFIRAQQGEVLADNVGLLVAAGRPLRYDDPSTMGPAISSGVWDQSTLLAEVAAQRFSAILVPLNANKDKVDVSGRWSPEFIATLREHYKVLYRDRITTYVPK